MKTILSAATRVLLAAALGAASFTALAQADDCKNRGQLDTLYCDENKDLVADTPKDAKRWKNPSTLVFTYTPVEDPAVYENIFKPFTDYLSKCTAKRVVFYQVQSNAAEIEAMRSGRLHVGGFSTGPTNFAVNLAGAVPFAVKGDSKEWQGYQLWLIVKKDSPLQRSPTSRERRLPMFNPRPTPATWRRARYSRRSGSFPTRTTRCCTRASTTTR